MDIFDNFFEDLIPPVEWDPYTAANAECEALHFNPALTARGPHIESQPMLSSLESHFVPFDGLDGFDLSRTSMLPIIHPFEQDSVPWSTMPASPIREQHLIVPPNVDGECYRTYEQQSLFKISYGFGQFRRSAKVEATTLLLTLQP
ncbi:hypothetical protein EYR40_009445 [Pleurotus pulmonarius]|nr:hypothetical protein EYR38_009455 [Pleurotus pulmonarius]KAF4590848.1 hypothetical protein EYR40_009445 [Pleurotus pulmonarius]